MRKIFPIFFSLLTCIPPISTASAHVFLINHADSEAELRLPNRIIVDLRYEKGILQTREWIEVELPTGTHAWLRRVTPLSRFEVLPLEEPFHPIQNPEPYKHQVRRLLFQGTTLNFIFPSRALIPFPHLSEESLLAQPPLIDFRNFSGGVITSSTSRSIQLPENFEDWLRERDIHLSEPFRKILAQDFNQNREIASIVFHIKTPGKFVLGPFLTSTTQEEKEQLLYPLLPIPAPSTHPASLIEFVLHAETKSTSEEWRFPQSFHTQEIKDVYSYEDPIPGAVSIFEKQYKRGDNSVEIIHAFLQASSGAAQKDILLTRTQNNPSSTDHLHVSRGNFIDLLMAFIFGASTLFAPESLLLVFIARGIDWRQGAGFVKNLPLLLWPMYSLLFGIYRLGILHSWARLSAITPILVTLVWLWFKINDPLIKQNPVRIYMKKKTKTSTPTNR